MSKGIEDVPLVILALAVIEFLWSNFESFRLFFIFRRANRLCWNHVMQSLGNYLPHTSWRIADRNAPHQPFVAVLANLRKIAAKATATKRNESSPILACCVVALLFWALGGEKEKRGHRNDYFCFRVKHDNAVDIIANTDLFQQGHLLLSFTDCSSKGFGVCSINHAFGRTEDIFRSQSQSPKLQRGRYDE